LAPDQTDQQATTDRAADEAVRLVVASYAAELAGRPLNRRQRDLQRRAAALARVLSRPAPKGRPPDDVELP
jgi:hypothetical protein